MFEIFFCNFQFPETKTKEKITKQNILKAKKNRKKISFKM